MSELQKNLKNDISCLLAAFIIFNIILKIVFYNESFAITVKSSLAFFWLFVLPGFALTLYWHEKISAIERIILGTGLGAAIQVFLTYYTGWFGLNLSYQPYILPILILIIAAIILIISKNHIKTGNYP